jgi:hypothetical protein
VAVRELQGWQPDPFGLHEMRYFSVGRPTKLVRDGRVEAYDEPPVDGASPSAAIGAQAVAVGGEQAAGDRAGLAAAGMSNAAVASTTLSTAAVPGQSDPAASTRVLAPLPADELAAQAAHTPVGRRKRGWMEYAFVAAGAVVAVLVFVALEGGGSGKPGIAPAAFVTKASQQTLAQHSADFTLSATATVGGGTVAIGGNGKIDLATGAMSLNVGASTSAGAIAETELEVGGNNYLKLTENGHGLPLSGGRHWIESPFAATAGSFETGSPDSSLEYLSQQGDRVTSLGTQNIGGQRCNGYSVIPSTQAMAAGAKQEAAKIGLSTAQTNAALQALQNVQPPTITAWFATKTNLTCQVTFAMQFGAPTSSGSGSVESELTFTHYGVPVTIAAPSASDTVDLQQYLQGVSKL